MTKNKKNKNKHLCYECGRTISKDFFEEMYEDGFHYEKYEIRCKNCHERENAYQILADIGVPFDRYSEPVGIWSD